MKIHPTAVIHPKAVLADDVEVGAYSVVGEHVTIGAGTRVFSHVAIDGWTEIGTMRAASPCIGGGPPQHISKRADQGCDRSRQYSARVCDREPGDCSGWRRDLRGNSNFFMAYVHVAHDCHLG